MSCRPNGQDGIEKREPGCPAQAISRCDMLNSALGMNGDIDEESPKNDSISWKFSFTPIR